MDTEQIKAKVKQNVARITGIAVAEIDDAASYREDLALDSLSMLELTVDLEFTFKIKVPQERLAEINTVEDTVRLVQQHVATGA